MNGREKKGLEWVCGDVGGVARGSLRRWCGLQLGPLLRRREGHVAGRDRLYLVFHIIS